jgi:hypothetical protein
MLELLCLDAEEYLISRRDGQYVALREDAGGVLVGLTRQGVVHLVAFQHDRPVLLERRVASETAGGAEPRARIEGRRVVLEELSVTLPCEGGRLLSDTCVALPDGRVLGIRWSSATWTELSPSHPRHPLVAKWSAARALVRGGAVCGSASVLWVAPLLLADGRCGSSFFCDASCAAGTRVRLVSAGEPVERASWEGAAVTASGALVYGRRRRHPRLGWTDVAAKEGGGGWVATHADGSTFDGHALTPAAVVPEGEDARSIPHAPCTWGGHWLDPFLWSMRDASGVEVWGDNNELSWWPVAVRGGQCVAVALSRPLRVVRHPIGDSEGQSVALACRAAQLRLHAAVTRHAARPELIHSKRKLSRSLELFCLARVARRLDPPLWPLLLPEPATAVREALTLSPHLASLLLPIALHESPHLEGQALAAQLLGLQLRLGLLLDARDTTRFAFAGRAEPSVLASHCRSLRVHRRPLSLLRLVALLLPLDEGVAECASNHYCALHPDQAPLHLWNDLVLPLASALGLGSPVLAADNTLRLPMTAETRQLLSLLLSPRVAAPLRLAGALLLLRPREALAARGDTVLRDAAPPSWAPLLDMLEPN